MAERMQIMWQMLKKNYGDQRRYCLLKNRRSRIQRLRKKKWLHVKNDWLDVWKYHPLSVTHARVTGLRSCNCLHGKSQSGSQSTSRYGLNRSRSGSVVQTVKIIKIAILIFLCRVNGVLDGSNLGLIQICFEDVFHTSLDRCQFAFRISDRFSLRSISDLDWILDWDWTGIGFTGWVHIRTKYYKTNSYFTIATSPYPVQIQSDCVHIWSNPFSIRLRSHWWTRSPNLVQIQP